MKISSLFSKKSAGVGLDLGSEWLKMVKISPGRKGYALASLSRSPWQPGDANTQAATAKRVGNLWEQLALKDKTVVSSLAGNAVIIKRVAFEAESLKVLPGIVEKDARQYIPFDIDDVYLDFEVLGEGEKEKTFEVLLVASKKKAVQNLNESLAQANLELSIVDVDSCALCNSFEYNYPELREECVYLLDIGGAQSIFCIYQNEQPLFFREVSFGGKAVTDAIASALNIRRTEAERIKVNGGDELTEEQNELVLATMDKTIRAWCDETKRLIGFYQTSSESIPAVNSIFLSGGGALLGGLQQVFHEELRLDVQYHNPFRKLKVDENQFQKEYLKEIAPQMVVPFGLALRGV